jgi:hypothetical protein
MAVQTQAFRICHFVSDNSGQVVLRCPPLWREDFLQSPANQRIAHSNARFLSLNEGLRERNERLI